MALVESEIRWSRVSDPLFHQTKGGAETTAYFVAVGTTTGAQTGMSVSRRGDTGYLRISRPGQLSTLRSQLHEWLSAPIRFATREIEASASYQKSITANHQQIPDSRITARTIVDVCSKFLGANQVIFVRAQTTLSARSSRQVPAHSLGAATLSNYSGALVSRPCLIPSVSLAVLRST